MIALCSSAFIASYCCQREQCALASTNTVALLPFAFAAARLKQLRLRSNRGDQASERILQVRTLWRIHVGESMILMQGQRWVNAL